MSLFTTDIKQDPISKLNLHFYTELCKHNNSTSRADMNSITVFKYRNKIGKIVIKAAPYSVT